EIEQRLLERHDTWDDVQRGPPVSVRKWGWGSPQAVDLVGVVDGAEVDGTGVGLAIVKRLVEEHGRRGVGGVDGWHGQRLLRATAVAGRTASERDAGASRRVDVSHRALVAASGSSAAPDLAGADSASPLSRPLS